MLFEIHAWSPNHNTWSFFPFYATIVTCVENEAQRMKETDISENAESDIFFVPHINVQWTQHKSEPRWSLQIHAWEGKTAKR
jgi:hypothetical protein